MTDFEGAWAQKWAQSSGTNPSTDPTRIEHLELALTTCPPERVGLGRD